jgi:rhodanese-related sulfurtransferase
MAFAQALQYPDGPAAFATRIRGTAAAIRHRSLTPRQSRKKPQRRTIVFQADDAQPEVMSADVPAGVYLLDVREDDEWAAGHAPDAVHVRLSELNMRSDEIPRDREVYVICRSGSRSAYATQALAGAGWNAINVADGMTGWAVADRPMVSETGAEPYVA